MRDARRLGLRMAALGAGAQVTGLGVDAWMHARDPGLAAREGVFSLENVGHSLLISGIALVVLGTALTLAGPWLYGRSGQPGSHKRRLAQVLASVALLGLLAGGTAFGATSSMAQHHPALGADHHGAPPARPQPPVIPDQPVDPAIRDVLAAQLVEARAAAARYATVSDALADGYQMVVPYYPGLGTHYMKYSLVDATLDVAHPEMLLYEGTAPDSKIVGLSYLMLGPTEPEGFAGPNDHWHRHIGLCVKAGVVIGGELMSPQLCAMAGGAKADGSQEWMGHAWVVPGWESPQGVFSVSNPNLP